jgi:hypothetical protein
VTDPYKAFDIAFHEAEINAFGSFYGDYYKKQAPLNTFAKRHTQEAKKIEPRH